MKPYIVHLNDCGFACVRGVAAWMRSKRYPCLWAIVSECGDRLRWATVDDFGTLVPVEVPA